MLEALWLKCRLSKQPHERSDMPAFSEGVHHQWKRRMAKSQLMVAWTAYWPGRWIIRSGLCFAALAMLRVIAGESAGAQTLTAPNPPPKSHPAQDTAKSPSTERMKSCSAYGAGFVQVPGS